MKAGKSRIITIILTIVLFIMTGCGSQPAGDSVIEIKDITNLTLDTVTVGSVTASYESNTWYPYTEENLSSPTIYLKATYGTDNVVYINVQTTGAYIGEITENHRIELMKTFNDMGGYITTDVSEMRTMGGKQVIYTESTMKITDAYLDLLLQNNAITEEYIDAYGGREALLNTAPTKQIVVYAVADGNLCTYIGTYYEEAQKQLVLDEITVLYATTQITE